MDFKGTSGKWKLATNDYGYYTSVRNLDDTRKVVVSRVNNPTESNANMLLISKAPEMLEMLNKINITISIHGKIDSETELHYQLNKLIKEATEL